MPDVDIIIEPERGRCIVSNVRMISKKQVEKAPNWHVVALVFGVGSGRANALCREWWIDPNTTETR